MYLKSLVYKCICIVLGEGTQEGKFLAVLEALAAHIDQQCLSTPNMKVFNPKHDHVPKLDDYKLCPPDDWWAKWPKLTWEKGSEIRSKVSPNKLLLMATAANYPDIATVTDIVNDLKFGCDIGCRGVNLCPSTSSNAPSAYEYGDRVTDSIVDGIKTGIMIGPLEDHEVPFDTIKINGIMAKLKPNGSARIILNLSKGFPFSVNEGIDNDQFEVYMSSTVRWLRAIHSAGIGCYMAKIDWKAAYKHLRVKHSDVRLQFFRWMGKLFAELCLIFGGISSVGLYDRLARLVLFIVLDKCEILRRQVARHLDDSVAAGTKEQTAEFYNTYISVCGELGIELADTSDHDKAFSPCQQGQVFGIEYDTSIGTWWLREDKIAFILEALTRVVEEPEQTLRFMKSVAGKIIDIRLMVPSGKFNVGQLIRHGIGETADLDKLFSVSDWCRAEAMFWMTMLPFCCRRLPLPDPDDSVPAWALQAYTDSAGGSTQSIGVGMGAVIYPNWWTYAAWGRAINSGKRYRDGKKLANKMSAWELLPCLAVLCAGSEVVRGRPLVIHVDNSGSVAIFKKGWCTSCMLCTTLVVAINQVAAAVNCRVEIRKIKRCSTPGARAADAISKAAFSSFRHEMPGASEWPAEMPEVLLDWIRNPVEDRLLGQKVLQEMGRNVKVVGYN